MAYKVFVAGEEALAADVNGYLMAQTVSRFPSAATRAAQLTGPVVNQLSILDDRPGIVQRWNGSAWADNTTTLADATVTTNGPLIQSGSAVATTDAFGSLNINFPTPFGSGNRRVIGNNGDANAAPPFFVGVIAGNPSGVTFGCQSLSGPIANGTLRVDWIAIGVRP